MKRIANSLKEFSAGNKMRAHPMGEWASARKHARAKQASLYNKLLGCRGATPAFSLLGLASFFTSCLGLLLYQLRAPKAQVMVFPCTFNGDLPLNGIVTTSTAYRPVLHYIVKMILS